MKTKEFIKKVEELGFETHEDGSILFIHEKGSPAGLVGLEEMYYMRVKTDSKELFELCVEYTQTPIEEREEEEKFYLKKIRSFYDRNYNEGFNFLNFRKNGNCFCLHSFDETYKYKAQFTQKEIDDIKKKFNTDLEEFEQIEVK